MSQNQDQQAEVPTGTLLKCEGSLDISQAGDLKIKLIDALDTALPITIHAKSIEKADTAGLQLLTAFFIDARAKGVSVTWEEPSESLVKSAKLAGLSRLMALDTNGSH